MEVLKTRVSNCLSYHKSNTNFQGSKSDKGSENQVTADLSDTSEKCCQCKQGYKPIQSFFNLYYYLPLYLNLERMKMIQAVISNPVF